MGLAGRHAGEVGQRGIIVAQRLEVQLGPTPRYGARKPAASVLEAGYRVFGSHKQPSSKVKSVGKRGRVRNQSVECLLVKPMRESTPIPSTAGTAARRSSPTPALRAAGTECTCRCAHCTMCSMAMFCAAPGATVR